jgi:hypothetical protein
MSEGELPAAAFEIVKLFTALAVAVIPSNVFPFVSRRLVVTLGEVKRTREVTLLDAAAPPGALTA